MKGKEKTANIIQENVRKRELGTIIVTVISDFLLSSNIATSVDLFVRPDNIAGIKLTTDVGLLKVKK